MKHCLRLLYLCTILLIFPSLALASKTHRVKKHETVYSLAKKYHVSVEELKAANNIVGDHIKARTVLVIPPRTVAAPARVSNTYKVKKSESLAKIARKTGVSVAELKRLNGAIGKKVAAGKVLVLRESSVAVEEAAAPKVASVKKLQLRHPDLFSDRDYEQSLQELAELEPEAQVDLRKNTELKVDNVRELKRAAYGFLGTRYRFGGTSRTAGIDCSGFVQKVFRDLSVSLPRTAREQFEVGNPVAPGDLQKGDLIFFSTYAPYASHVGIYLGNSKMIHASSRDHRVVISPMNTPYYRSRFLGAKRIAKVNPDVFKLDDLILGVEEEQEEDASQNDALGLNGGDEQ
ncbi:NlpC/P60 family protein [Geomonas sp. RF6]|uniref:C40 family peptidase n=1 Tax=Geomonas sp. RF6 TaxID=2897342 RepID=UPI001E5BED58|nr:C40 family peptidase [Geomonas sp. RF6]UFS68686.1 NlpC/P60 family protein [Geomonas sp. RF6]